jgi:hypothetical protein
VPGKGKARNEAGTGGGIVIHISIHTVEPVSGKAKVDGGPPVQFEGWLDLLERLSDLVSRAGSRAKEERRGAGETASPSMPPRWRRAGAPRDHAELGPGTSGGGGRPLRDPDERRPKRGLQ